MPGLGTPTALQYIGNDRLILRGFTESDAGYAGRLTGAFTSWDYAGSARAVLQQTLGLLSTFTPLVRTVASNTMGGNDSTVWDTYPVAQDATTPPLHQRLTPNNFDWDSLSVILPRGWWRSWLIFYAVAPQDFCASEGTWGDGDVWGDDGKSWGLNIPPSEVQALRSTAATFKQAGATLEWIIISFDAGLFDPAQTSDGVHNPDGKFGYWYKIVNGQYVPSRFANARYADGVL
jgi:hypothetical protein